MSASKEPKLPVLGLFSTMRSAKSRSLGSERLSPNTRGPHANNVSHLFYKVGAIDFLRSWMCSVNGARDASISCSDDEQASPEYNLLVKLFTVEWSGHCKHLPWRVGSHLTFHG